MSKERTLAILKPDCVRKELVGEVIRRIQAEGFEILAMKMTRLTKKTAGAFYKVHRERPFYDDLCQFMRSGACVPLILEKENAVQDFRVLIGATNPEEAEDGTIRADFADSIQENIVHGSDSIENGKKETRFFFSEAEVVANKG
jgi:nucleoside-diphosphate kinase